MEVSAQMVLLKISEWNDTHKSDEQQWFKF